MTLKKKSKNQSKVRFTVHKLENPPYVIDSIRLRPYDQRYQIFNRVSNESTWPGYGRTEEEAGLRNIAENKPGYTRLDYALAEAAWTVHEVWTESFSWERLGRTYGPSLMGEEWFKEKYVVEDPAWMTKKMKRAARLYGASLVGVAKLDRCWLYANRRYDLAPLIMPEGIENVVVMAIEMDKTGIATSPACAAAAATGVGYSRMAVTASCLAEFIRNLGYTALPAGNDIGLSIPFAIDAGLGQLGRNGLLVTPEYGPRVRLCKVFTDLPLMADKPIDFGVTEKCRRCKLCAEACEVEAISKATEPSWEPACRSSSPGVLKWYVDGEKCYEYWCDNGADCSSCISVCPYNTGTKHAEVEEFWREGH